MNTPADTGSSPAPASRSPRGRRTAWWTAGVVAVSLAIGGILIASLGGSDTPTSVTFGVPNVDPTMQMCLTLDEFVPSTDQLGFGGTVTSITDGQVTLDVDRWYRGGPADQAVLDTSDLPIAALDGVEFVIGQRYLVSIFDGEVGICGTSGPASPELERYFDTWFD